MKTSDAVTQSVERCDKQTPWKRHSWVERCGEHPQPYKHIVCETCGWGPSPESKDGKRAEAILYLRKLIPKGDTVYTILKHVSRSGMTRGIDCYAIVPKGGLCTAGHNTGLYAEPVWITGYVGHAIDSPQPIDYWRKSLGLKVDGCGMDMGFHVVNSLSYALYDDGNAIKHAWL